MVRQIIKIDESKCDGCGLCVSACQEGAISLVAGKAKLLRDDYCDGLGNCLPACPAEAIAFEEREAAGFDEAAAKANANANAAKANANANANAAKADIDDGPPATLACGCPGTHSKSLGRAAECEPLREQTPPAQTHLNQWPVQIKLVPTSAPYFKNANLLVAADCAAYAYGNFHDEYMKNRITIIGCPKLDEADYSKKLAAILKANDIKSVTAIRMEVPCCGGIENAAKAALKDCGKLIPWQVATISTDGKVLD